MNGILLDQPTPRHRTAGKTSLHVVGLAMLACILIGCGNPEPPRSLREGTGPPASFDDNLSASEILATTISKYRNADRYSDRAVLYMSYRLNGRPIQEPQPWAVAYERSGRFASDLFNAQIRCDGQLLSCYIYDIASGNLDNQRLILPAKDKLPVVALYEDSIANHFIAGFADMPLVANKQSSQPQLVPPTIGLLTGLMKPSWLRSDGRIERYEDSEIDGRTCFVLRCWQSDNENDHVDVWIDKENSTIWQAALPIDCLEAKVRTSPEITDLRMVARFHEASFNSDQDDSKFALKPRSDSTPVSRMVKLPEPLMSELISMKAPEYEFETQSGKTVSSTDLGGQLTTLLWIGDEPGDSIYKFDQLKKSMPPEIANFGIIYSDRDLADSNLENNVMNMELNEIARNTNLSFYYDKQLGTSMLLRIKSVPSVVVIDKDATVQFATGLTDQQWPTKVGAAIERVAAGENVGGEMIGEYEKFLENYHQQLLAVSATGLIGRQTDGTFQQMDGVAKGRIRPTRTWTNSQFKFPGNIVAVANGESHRLFVFDGWRTIVELDASGKAIMRRELELPENDGVNLIRKATDAQGKNWYAAFMSLGKQVYVFDENWVLITNYPKTPGPGIRDVEISHTGTMLVAFDGNHGVHEVNPFTDVTSKLSNVSATSIDRFGKYGISDGALVRLRDGQANSAFSAWQLNKIGNAPQGQCCLGTAKDGRWFAIGINQDSVDWSANIGRQLFEKTIESVTATNENNPRWAIANSDGGIHIFNHDGSWLGDFKSEFEVLGLALLPSADQLRLIVSTGEGVTNWNLDISQNAARAASHLKDKR